MKFLLFWSQAKAHWEGQYLSSQLCVSAGIVVLQRMQDSTVCIISDSLKVECADMMSSQGLKRVFQKNRTMNHSNTQACHLRRATGAAALDPHTWRGPSECASCFWMFLLQASSALTNSFRSCDSWEHRGRLGLFCTHFCSTVLGASGVRKKEGES